MNTKAQVQHRDYQNGGKGKGGRPSEEGLVNIRIPSMDLAVTQLGLPRERLAYHIYRA